MSEPNYKEGSDVHTQALLRFFDSNLRYLRDIKRMEMIWLQLFSVVVAPTTAFFAATRGALPLRVVIPVQILLALFTIWIQRVLFLERQSYYNVLRSVVRLENYFGLFDSNHLPTWMQNSPFPEGMGPDKRKDGTQRNATIFHRYLYTVSVLLALVLATSYRAGEDFSVALFWGSVFVGLDALACVSLNIRDKSEMERKNREERKLSGGIVEWAPDPPGIRPTESTSGNSGET